MRALLFAPVVLLCVAAGVLGQPASGYRPDPLSVRRHGPAYRYPQAGWVVLHIEGEPYDRGYQHGRLMAAEIAAYLRCFAAIQNSKAPTEGWKTMRTLVNAVFVRRFDPEYLEEMKGIAAGASAAGAKFDGRPIDLVDVVAINCWAELETLDVALEATPNGLEGIRFPNRQPKETPASKPMHCSAFAATGPATRDGKIVFGHVTMFDLYPSLFYNVWLDVKPAKGHRVLMQTCPGGIQSGMDYYINDAGLLVSETTIGQTRFDPRGTSLTSRIRQAVQYSDSIDRAVAVLRKDGNGLYSNEWLLADIKTNEIAMLELGTATSKLWRSSKGEWFGGTEGFYWGCNNAKDLDVRLDTVASVRGKPANMVWKPTDRDRKWLELYEKSKGKIDAEFGKLAYSTAPLVSAITIDAKFTTSDLAKQLKTHALFGPPLGKPWQPSDDEKQKYSEIRPLVGNPWTILHVEPPSKDKPEGPAVVDLPDKVEAADSGSKSDGPQTILRTEDRSAPTEPSWFGTVLPKGDADVWLAAAFADYERIVALEKSLAEASDGKLSASDRDRLAIELYAHRSGYLAAARSRAEVPLSKTRSELTQDEWYRVASGKGVLVLQELRQLLGDQAFVEIMESFGKENAGKQVTGAQFRAHVEKAAGKKVENFFDYWCNEPGLPLLRLAQVKRESDGKGSVITGMVLRGGKLPAGVVEVTVETEKGEETQKVTLENGEGKFEIKTKQPARRLVVDKYAGAARANGGAYSITSFQAEPEHALIVYGTGDDLAANRETAEALQEAIRSRWSNMTVPIKTDKEVKDDELKSHHLLLIGRPDSNAVLERMKAALPVGFGRRSFTVRDEAYANSGSAILAAGENPLNKRYSVVALSGLSSDATLALPPVLLKKDLAASEVLVVPASGKTKALVIPARELVQEFPKE